MQYNQPFDQPSLPNAPFVNGNPGTGVAGSIPPAAQMEFPQREIVNALMAAGLTPTNNDLTQLVQAISIGLWLGAMSGSANAITDVLPTLATTSDGVTQSTIPALVVGMTFHGIIPATNTGAATLTLTGFGTAPGAKPIVRKDGTPVQAGDLPANALVTWRWDGTSYRVTSAVPSDILSLIVASPYAGTRGVAFITSTQTWPVPAGVSYLKRVRIWAAGGGGGGSNGSGSAASAGGGGGYAEKYNIAVTAAMQANGIPVTIGASGAQGTSNPTGGGQGGSTSFSNIFAATGGGGGLSATNGIQNSGAGIGGQGQNGDVNLTGTNGSYGYSVGSQPGNGIGGSAPFGGACPTPNFGTIGNFGNFPGGGANGGSGTNAGGGGGLGLCIVEY